FRPKLRSSTICPNNRKHGHPEGSRALPRRTYADCVAFRNPVRTTMVTLGDPYRNAFEQIRSPESRTAQIYRQKAPEKPGLSEATRPGPDPATPGSTVRSSNQLSYRPKRDVPDRPTSGGSGEEM